MISNKLEEKNSIIFFCLFDSLTRMIDGSFPLLMFCANFLIKPLKKYNEFFHDCHTLEKLVFFSEKKLFIVFNQNKRDGEFHVIIWLSLYFISPVF